MVYQKGKKKRESYEEKLQVAAVNLMQLILPRDAMLHHSHNEGKRSKADAGRAKAMGQRSGYADLIIHWQSVTYFIEFKYGRNTQTENQRQFEADLKATGFPNYAVIYSIDELIATLRRWGFPIRTVGNAGPVRKIG